MTSVEKAIQLCLEKTNLGNIEELHLSNLKDGFLSADLYSSINLPSFRNSAMDGYALLYSDYEKGLREFKITGEIKAGDTNTYNLDSGTVYRIFTGAPTPLNCDLVIMQEHIARKDNQIIIEEENSKPNQNIRQIGEQVKEGDLALSKGSELNSASIGYLASIGAATIKSISAPKVTVVSTGDELVAQNQELKFGQIYESNSFGLLTELKKTGITQLNFSKLKDDYQETLLKIKELIETQDYLILTGGISVGDYDFVGEALKELEVEEVFYKVAQKPGKPLFFGRKNNCHIFALPGNPAAALTCLHIYVKSSIRKYRGGSDCEPKFRMVRAENNFIKKGNRAQFLKAKMNANSVSILEGQSSNMMHTFAVANTLVYLDENTEEIKVGDLVKSLLI